METTWKRPSIEANTLFSRELASPLPRHLLERALAEDKAGFAQLPYLSHEYVGTGPFKLRELALGSHLLFQANDQFVLGRPRTDEIEVKILPDHNTNMANLLAGAVDLMLGREFNFDRAMLVEEQMNLFYSLQFTLIAHRLANVEPSKSSGAASKTWNSHLRDLRS